MHKRKKFFRGRELGCETRTLAGPVYNNIRRLIRRSNGLSIVVPIKKLQIMAVIKESEVFFVDIHFQHVIEFAWQSFDTQSRDNLTSSVSYTFRWYNKHAYSAMKSLPDAFALALENQLERMEKTSPLKENTLLSFPAHEKIAG